MSLSVRFLFAVAKLGSICCYLCHNDSKQAERKRCRAAAKAICKHLLKDSFIRIWHFENNYIKHCRTQKSFLNWGLVSLCSNLHFYVSFTARKSMSPSYFFCVLEFSNFFLGNGHFLAWHCSCSTIFCGPSRPSLMLISIADSNRS